VTADGPTRVYALLRDALPVLLDFGGAAHVAGDRVRRVGATAAGMCELPVIGTVPLPEAVLVRPDGHVAWAGDGDAPGLRDAMHTWFGA
jgi:3-(3-hydroxy-phenyl)propionate hydroxylase